MLDCFEHAVRAAAMRARPPDAPPTWAQHAPTTLGTLAAITQASINMFNLSMPPSGLVNGIGWWQCANGYTAIALHDIWSGTDRNYARLSTALRQCESRQPDFVNEFNDDTLWFGLCCLHMYSMKHDTWFLEKAERVWNHVRSSHSVCKRRQHNFCGKDMEGGCFWTTKPGEQQVNAISTGLFAELSVRLAMHALREENAESEPSLSSQRMSSRGHHRDSHRRNSDRYIETARCSLGWILRCRYMAEEGVVLDGLLLDSGVANDWTFTYTTGVTLGVCALLYETTMEEEYLELACHMANRAMNRSSWVVQGVLTEPGAYARGTHDPWQNNDAVGFKSVLVRAIATLSDVISRTNAPGAVARDMQDTIKAFVNTNLVSQLENNTNGNAQYGPWWAGPFECPTSHSQMAVLDVMAAARLVNRE